MERSEVEWSGVEYQTNEDIRLKNLQERMARQQMIRLAQTNAH